MQSSTEIVSAKLCSTCSHQQRATATNESLPNRSPLPATRAGALSLTCTGALPDSPLAVRASKAGEHSRHIQIFTRGCTIRQRRILFSSEQDIMDMGAKVTHAPTSIVTSPARATSGELASVLL